ncbi:MAG: histidine kinase, partial [Gammaproteobacteria bacterium]|nr:histidine kinase [Gammaproteobacteria bacterium]
MKYQQEPCDAGKRSAYPTLVFMALRLLRQHEIGKASEEEIPEFLVERFELDP